jgi:hypothetical protein
MAFAAILPILSGALAGIGAFAQGSAQAAEYKAQARNFEYDAAIQTQNAAIAGQQSSAEQERVRRESRQILGAQRAAIGESGTAFSGSNMDILRQSTANAELDALNVQYSGELERTSLLNQAEGSRFNAKVARSSAKSANRMRWLSAAGAGLSAYGGAGGNMFLGKQPGKG